MGRIWIEFMASVRKELRIIRKDIIGLLLMFLMPVVLVVIIASVQNSTFEMVNNNRLDLLILEQDTGRLADRLIGHIDSTGMFRIRRSAWTPDERSIRDTLLARDVQIAIEIPADYTSITVARATASATRTLARMGMGGDTLDQLPAAPDIRIHYLPAMKGGYLQTIVGGLRSSINRVEREENLMVLYNFMDTTGELAEKEKSMLEDQSSVILAPVMRKGSTDVLNATQHNVPAWTIFAMFFIVISLGGNLVREKMNGSFLRLRTMPAPFLVFLSAKQFTYLMVTVLQAVVIFLIGMYVFPHLGLPALTLPRDIAGLTLVTVLCGLCAVSYATCVGMYSQTPDQTNGFGAISIVIFSAIGGLMVPAFVMPDSIRSLMGISPLHWCLEAYYGLFLEGEVMSGFGTYVLPLILIAGFLQVLILIALKKARLF